MNKSKKERKVTRKRNADAENVNDEDSNSSRVISLYQMHVPKSRIADETYSPESTSLPTRSAVRSSSPSSIPAGMATSRNLVALHLER
ncbi:hypothetical protein R1flu_012651 [Riccia fluitans]|uniref:Uncharacterized protein n=1 Tax=Riccia fluitans TaxID=41844 RepID=A0ABD1ZDQ2_9MARC